MALNSLGEVHLQQAPRQAPALYLVIANISKRPNVRSLIASAIAFEAKVLVGEMKSWTLQGEF